MNESTTSSIYSSATACLVFVVAVSCSTQVAHQPITTAANSSQFSSPTENEMGAPSMQLTTYLLLPGTCKDAMVFYHSIFGGELTMTTVADSPMKEMFPVAMHARVVNARLKSKLVDISASDWLRPNQAPVQGNTVCLYLSGGSRDDTRTVFSKLAEGAEVTDPLVEQPFGLYGALNDTFGIRWMFQSK